ncbi:MAG: hypothetical protein LBK06_00145 [Planctomycetaceae bacterium]|nr:hypothetical protein [Planctomycetaceae bacterium]
MKKTNSMSSFLTAEINVNIDFTANVNLDKMGGGGGQPVKLETRIFVTIILREFLPSLLLFLAALLLLNFWL